MVLVTGGKVDERIRCVQSRRGGNHLSWFELHVRGFGLLNG
jgi:hypothetical protein